ncbi:hypothetical protein DSG85_10935 [Salmonella enterica subsp. enterica]|nr:hypothetical protein [Salmonella enterica subsp. enterica serovar Koketime]
MLNNLLTDQPTSFLTHMYFSAPGKIKNAYKTFLLRVDRLVEKINNDFFIKQIINSVFYNRSTILPIGYYVGYWECFFLMI